MSEQEEPVAKLAKLEGSMESMDEGQEEWLSEGVLTDDDGNPMADNDSSAVQSQDETMESEPALEELTAKLEEPIEDKKKDKENGAELNTDKIAEALDNMENEKTDKNKDHMPGDLSTFLVRKTDGTIVETKEKREDTDMESLRHSDETDANDTDELLRMLGDDDQKAKKKKEVRKIAEKKTKDDQSTDEEEVFTGKMTRLKSKLTKKIPPKAVPEVTNDDESKNLKSRLRTPKKPILKKTPVKTKSGGSDQENITPKVKGPKKIATKAVPDSDDDNVSSDDKNVMKKMFTTKKKVHFAAKSTTKPGANKYSAQAQREIEASKRLEALKKTQKPAVEVKEEQDIRAEEFLDEDLFDLVEYGEDAEMRGEGRSEGRGSGREAGRGARQPMMRPERMEEESLSDGDSPSDNSYYDDLPSTDSEEDLEDWFTFDIRAERAGDYLPLLGDKAHQILSEERARLAGRVSSLRHDLAAAATAARAHATSLRRAAAVVAELDASIKAAV